MPCPRLRGMTRETANEFEPVECGDCEEAAGRSPDTLAGPSITAGAETESVTRPAGSSSPCRTVILGVGHIRPRHQRIGLTRTPRCATVGGYSPLTDTRPGSGSWRRHDPGGGD